MSCFGKIFIGICLFPCFCLVSCATNPVTKQSEFVLMSEEQEIRAGREMDPAIRREYGTYASPELQGYVSSVGRSLAAVSDRAGLVYRFTVLDSPVVNAFALPGGYVYITRGLLAYLNSEAELAGVLAHEIGHITARHAVRQYTKAATYQIGASIASIFAPDISQSIGRFADVVFAAVSSGYSRQYESEADSLAVTYALRAGFDPRAVETLLATLQRLSRDKKESYTSLFASHPPAEKRIADVERLAGSVPPGLVTNRRVFLEQIDGLVFGDDVSQGVVRGSLFQHPDMKIAVRFPEGWPVENRPEAVIARRPETITHIFLGSRPRSKHRPVDASAASLERSLGLVRISGSPERINGLDAFTGIYSGRHARMGPFSAAAGFFMVDDTVFFIVGRTSPQQFSTVRADFFTTIRSFARLSAEEAAAIKPVRLRLYTVRPGDTLGKIVQRSGGLADDLKTTALLNGWDPDHLPVPYAGQVIKVLENG